MKKWLKRISLGILLLLIIVGIVAVYGFYIEPRRLIVTENSLKVPNFSLALNGLKVVAISDIHGGSAHVTEEKLRKIVETANAQNPDLIVLLGDYVSQIDGKNSDLKMPIKTIASNLQGFKARYGVYGIIGNHDWWFDDKKVELEFERAGIKILENETESIQIGEETVWIWGIEDYWRGRRVPLQSSYDKIPTKKNIIAITHNPDSLLKAPGDISIMFAGHSHGGQIYIPFYGREAFVNDERFMYGHAEVDGKNVFVTAGIGTSIIGFRFLVPPEISVVTLTAAN
jgi:uncharacterized protein